MIVSIISSVNTQQSISAKPKQSLPKKSLLVLGIIAGLALYGGVVSYGTAWYLRDQDTKAGQAVDPRKVVQESLVKNLSLTTVKRHIIYRDNADRGMLVDWDLTSDFGNPRAPKTKGFLTLTWLRDKTEHKQKLEMVILPSKNYTNTGYFRVVEGAELTKAPADWFKVDFSSYSGEPRGGKLYERQGSYSYGKDSFGSIFANTPYKDAMNNFRGFDFARYSSPASWPRCATATTKRASPT